MPWHRKTAFIPLHTSSKRHFNVLVSSSVSIVNTPLRLLLSFYFCFLVSFVLFHIRLLFPYWNGRCTKAPTGAVRTKLTKAHSFDRFKRDSAVCATELRAIQFFRLVCFFLDFRTCIIFIATAFSFLSSVSWTFQLIYFIWFYLFCKCICMNAKRWGISSLKSQQIFFFFRKWHLAKRFC